MPKVLRAVQRALWREPGPTKKPTEGKRGQGHGDADKITDAPVAQGSVIPVAWGEALIGKRLLIQGDTSGAEYRWVGQMECGRERRYLLLVAAADEGNPRAEQRVVPFEVVRKVGEA